MRYAIDIPNFGDFADPHLTAAIAREAETAGWDAIWVWDHIMRDPADPHADPWLLLAGWRQRGRYERRSAELLAGMESGRYAADPTAPGFRSLRMTFAACARPSPRNAPPPEMTPLPSTCW